MWLVIAGGAVSIVTSIVTVLVGDLTERRRHLRNEERDVRIMARNTLRLVYRGTDPVNDGWRELKEHLDVLEVRLDLLGVANSTDISVAAMSCWRSASPGEVEGLGGESTEVYYVDSLPLDGLKEAIRRIELEIIQET